LRAGRTASQRFGWRGLLIGCALCLASVWSIHSVNAEPRALDIVRATAGLDQKTNKPIVNITLTKASKQDFGQFTAGNVGGKMGLRVNDQVLSIAVLREPLVAESFQISGDFSVDETNAMAGRLSAPGARIEIEFVPN
jgi:preprotein translocase subunit SecD